MSNEIDELMSRLEEDPFACPPQDLDKLINYYRNMRTMWESGVKPQKEDGPKISLKNIVTKLAPEKPAGTGLKRRF